MSYNTSPTIDAWSCHMIHHLLLMHGHVMLYINYHSCMVMSYVASPTIDAWSCHMIHHLLPMHGHVILYITYHRYMDISYVASPINLCMVMSYDTSLTIDAWSCLMIHHLLSMHGHVILYITYHRYMDMSYDKSPTIDAWSCHVVHHLLSMHGHVI